jgi:hypothetical protein
VAKALLFLALAFTIMADPISSVAYTIEASLRALHGRLAFGVMTLLFVGSAVAVLVHGFSHPVIPQGHAPVTG